MQEEPERRARRAARKCRLALDSRRDRLEDRRRLRAGIKIPEDHRVDDVERRRGKAASDDHVRRARITGLRHDDFFGSRVGRRSSTPPQFGHLPPSLPCAQAEQKVHS